MKSNAYENRLQREENEEVMLELFKASTEMVVEATDEHYTKFLLSDELAEEEAYIVETTHYYILVSYDEIVAVIDKKFRHCFDCLRLYGYFARSANHIQKFCQSHGKLFTFSDKRTWRAI